MKILFYQTSLSAKIIFNVAEKLEKNFLVKTGHLYKFSNNNSYFYKQSVLKQNKRKIYIINSKSKTNKIDYEYLKYFEKKISNKNIWKIFSFDRDYGGVYIKDIDFYDIGHSYKNIDSMLLNFIAIAKSIEKIFKKFRPTVVYIPNGLSSIEVTIIECFANYFKIKLLTPEPYRFKNYFYFSNALGDVVNKNIEKKYNICRNKNIKNNEINKIYNEIVYDGLSISADADATIETLKKEKKKNSLPGIFIFFIYAIIKHSFFKIFFSLGIKLLHLKYLKDYKLFNSIKIEIKTKLNCYYLYSIKPLNLDLNYVYFPLHLVPETTTLVKGNNYINQEFLIECISKNIPANYKLYVKEHPNQILSHPRKRSFYQRVQSLPNVELVNPLEDSRKIISKSKLIIIVAGSSGFEGLLYGVPSLVMEPNNYDFLNFSVENKNIKNLYFDIKRALALKSNFNKKKHEKKIKNLLKSIVIYGYNLRDPETFYFFKKDNLKGEKICTDDLYESLARELKLINSN